MLFRFSLYGFLKNQQYYEPFLILALREKGLGFGAIGVLIGFRELCANLLQVPTGAISDVLGRRRSMVASFLFYLGSFLILGWARQPGWLYLGMLLFGVGEAFRGGTHKAMIFDWLARQGRSDEKTRVYGLTRSWSKMGSMVSVIIGACLIFWIERYEWAFFISALPCLFNTLNLATYPAYLDGETSQQGKSSLRAVCRVMWAGMRVCWDQRPLRELLTQNMIFEGTHKVMKDYLQPVLEAMALSLPFLLACSTHQRTAVLIGTVYACLYLVSSLASRHAERVAAWAGSPERGVAWVWRMNALIFIAMTLGMVRGSAMVAIVALVCLTMVENLWHPVLVSSVANRTNDETMSTVLSVESQTKSLFAVVLAPLVGFAVEHMTRPGLAEGDVRRFLPVGLVGGSLVIVSWLRYESIMRRGQASV